jgi:hypothetical protein
MYPPVQAHLFPDPLATVTRPLDEALARLRTIPCDELDRTQRMRLQAALHSRAEQLKLYSRMVQV